MTFPIIPRLIVICENEPWETEFRSSVWVHFAPSKQLSLTPPIAGLIDRARAKEWRIEIDRDVALCEEIKRRLTSEDAQFVETEQGEFWLNNLYQAALEGRLGRRPKKLAEGIHERPTVVGLDIEEATSKWACPTIANELVNNSGLIRKNIVAFIRSDHGKGLPSNGFDDLMRHIMSTITAAKVTDETEKEGARLLEGETGVGKSELARALHQQLCERLNRNGPFVRVNIAAVSKGLLEARLRGHAKGAFTDAKQERKSWLEEADNGTLFLDELQAAPEAFQVQLLDLLNAVSDTVEVARVGEDHRRRRFLVRVVMATNESVEKLIQERRLREDLFYRIRSMLRLKPLAGRLREEINGSYLDNLLHLHRWRSAATLDIRFARRDAPDNLADRLLSCLLPKNALSARVLLCEHEWPGNLREFERVCFDAFQSYDRFAWPNWTEQEWSDAFGRAIEAAQITNADSSEVSNPKIDVKQDLQELFEMQEIICKHGFNLSAAIPDLKSRRLRSSRGAIRSFLQAHQAHLDPLRWTTARAQKLLGSRPTA